MSSLSRTNWILTIAAIWGAFALPILPRDNPPAKAPVELPRSEPFVISGVVIDPAGVQVAHARVWLHAQARLRRAERVVLALAETDAAGAFALVAPAEALASSIDLRAATVDEEGRIGWWEQFAGQVPRRLKLQLQDVTSFTGQVFSCNGYPLSRIRIVPRTAVIDEDGFEHFHHLPPELADRLTATTDDTGQFTISGVPEASYLFLDLHVGVSGRLSCQARTSQPVSIRVPQLGRLSGRFVWTETTLKKPFQPAEVELFEECCTATPEPGQVLLSFRANTRNKSDGMFEFTQVPVGEYLVQVAPGQRQFFTPKAFPVAITDHVFFTHVAIPVRPNREMAKPVVAPEGIPLRSVFDPSPVR